MYAWIYQSICYKIGFQDLDYELTASIGKFILFSVSMCSYMFFFITKWAAESMQQRTVSWVRKNYYSDICWSL